MICICIFDLGLTKNLAAKFQNLEKFLILVAIFFEAQVSRQYHKIEIKFYIDFKISKNIEKYRSYHEFSDARWGTNT